MKKTICDYCGRLIVGDGFEWKGMTLCKECGDAVRRLQTDNTSCEYNREGTNSDVDP